MLQMGVQVAFAWLGPLYVPPAYSPQAGFVSHNESNPGPKLKNLVRAARENEPTPHLT